MAQQPKQLTATVMPTTSVSEPPALLEQTTEGKNYMPIVDS